MFSMHNINIKERMDIMNLIVFVGKIKEIPVLRKNLLMGIRMPQ